MPKIVFRYFNARALGEAVRTILAYAGEEFEDIRYSEEEWPAYKPLTPFGLMPVLEIDGKVFAESRAICRYLAHKYGLAGDNLEEAFEIDQNLDFMDSIFILSISASYETDPYIREKKFEILKEEAPPLFKKLNDIIEKNNGHIAARKLTWGDFVFAGQLDYLKHTSEMPDLEQQYPNFTRVVEAVYSIPRVKAFSENAPKSDI